MGRNSVQEDDFTFVPLEEPDIWYTSDIGAAAAALCKSYELLSLNKENPRKVLFLFKKAKGLEEVASSYFDGTLTMSVRAFHDTLRALKNKLYSE